MSQATISSSLEQLLLVVVVVVVDPTIPGTAVVVEMLLLLAALEVVESRSEIDSKEEPIGCWNPVAERPSIDALERDKK